jgi:hypothetical protein
VNKVRLAAATIAAIGCTALFAPLAQATVRYAAPGGATGGDCTTEATACEINRAVEALAGTTEVVVLPGDYALGSDVGPAQIEIPPAVHVHGKAGAPLPVLSGGAANTSLFRVVQGSSRLSDVRIVKTSGSGGAILVGDGTAVVERVQAESTLDNGAGCSLVRGLIRDSACLVTGAHAVALGQNQNGAGVYAGKLRNVTAVATGTGNARGIAWDVGNVSGITMTLDAKNVIASGTSADVAAASSNAGSTTSVTLANSNYSTVSTTGTNPGTVTAPGSGANQIAEPVFTDLAAGDLHQAPASPTIDAGAPDADNGLQDIDRGARTVGPAADIGADEYVVPAPVLASISPSGPANHNTPLISGQAQEGTTVRLFTSADCSGEPAATGEAAAFAAPGLAVTVADNSTTVFRATATDAFGHGSDCSTSSLSYKELTPPPTGTNPPDPAQPKKKKKKCKKKKTRRKCKKKTRAP